MKKLTRILALTLLLATIFTISAIPAHAEGIVYNTITEGVNFTPIAYRDQSRYVYKYVVKTESIVKINYSGISDYTTVTVYKNKALTYEYNYNVINRTPSKGTLYVGLEKGTYYFYFAVPASSTAKFKLTSTPQEEINKQNYTKAKAIPLKAKNWVNVAQTPNYNYTRWYKIKLTKKQIIHIVTNEGAGNSITLFNSKYGQPSVARGSKQVFTQDKQPKGTYYIRVGAVSTTNLAPSAYIHMKWY